MECNPNFELETENQTAKEILRIDHLRGGKDRQRMRSEILPEYAEWFIKQFIAVKNGDKYEVM